MHVSILGALIFMGEIGRIFLVTLAYIGITLLSSLYVVSSLYVLFFVAVDSLIFQVNKQPSFPMEIKSSLELNSKLA